MLLYWFPVAYLEYHSPVLCHAAEAAARPSTVARAAAATGVPRRRLPAATQSRLAKWPVRRLWPGTQAWLVFQRPCARPDAPALLAAAAVDLAGRWHGVATQDRNPDGRPEVKSDIEGHFCRHRWRLRRGGLTTTLTLSANRKVEGQALLYVWVPRLPAPGVVYCTPLPAPLTVSAGPQLGGVCPALGYPRVLGSGSGEVGVKG